MKAIVVAVLTYYRVFPIQRWIGVGTLALAALIAALRSPTSIVILVIPVACLMFAVLGPLGMLFREISAVRSHRFLPYFRPQLLIAVVLVIAFFPTVGYVLLQFSPRGAPPASSWFVLATLLASVWLWFSFFLPTSLWAALFALPIGALIRWIDQSPYDLAIAAVALCAGWIAFVAWYLRTRAIVPAPSLRAWAQSLPLNWLERVDARLSDRSGTFAPSSAIESWLTGRYPLRLKDRLASAAFLLLILSLAWGFALRSPRLDRPDLLIAGSCAAIIPLLFAVAHNTARCARRLWLHGGKTRRELFGAVERNLWAGPLLVCGAAFVGFTGVARLVFDVELLWRAAPSMMGTSILATYLGLACVRRVVLTSWLSTPLVVILGFAGLRALESGNGRAFAAIVALELAAALAARAIAIRLWARIDWIALRPLRVPIVLGRFTR